jgi:hypothetical protein
MVEHQTTDALQIELFVSDNFDLDDEIWKLWALRRCALGVYDERLAPRARGGPCGFPGVLRAICCEERSPTLEGQRTSVLPQALEGQAFVESLLLARGCEIVVLPPPAVTVQCMLEEKHGH